ncbi:hypothetical protein [Vibrio sp. Vb0877]|jgi:hypothetical protein|uniref:hypothetical protein n=1 Tax=Vibrio sp. Vb0877 TaxID=2816073 RepID=UPI001A8F56E6|nr:hypothetical protein [Vibrio sp. Vb0877]MBO0211523.1 hypothetical protein [Vibrio sp. Vb0877]HBC3428498.1 hypothetical protein [Vibrio parahaemolyticus]
MFQFYGRRETSFVCAMCERSEAFERTVTQGYRYVSQVQLPRYVEENEFLLMFELDEKGRPTGNELTLFILSVYEASGIDVVLMEVVTGDPDAFWVEQLETNE